MKTQIDLAEWNMGEGVVTFKSFQDVLDFANKYYWDVEDVLDVLDISINDCEEYEESYRDYMSHGFEVHDSVYVKVNYIEAIAFGERMTKREDYNVWEICAA